MSEPISTAAKLNLETARIAWTALQRQFAQGALLVVTAEADLVETATLFVDDNQLQVTQMLANGTLRKADMEDAEKWQRDDDALWAVVVAPWVIVQEI